MINSPPIVNTTAFPQWEEILATALNLADEFGAVILGGPYNPENPFLNGKQEISSLPNLKVGCWPNIGHCS